MSDRMIPLPFGELYKAGVKEYYEKKSLFGVKVLEKESDLPIGPAAGPHTQLAENLVAAFAAGATVMELKTVQILEGAALGIQKPCIYVGNEVYNVEWSTELTVAEARDEYIKAYLLIRAFSKLPGLEERKKTEFIVSVGYDLEGIRSPKIDDFLNSMRDASGTDEWKNDIAWIRQFTDLQESFIYELEKETCVSDTVTLSTMHGCPAEDIEKIALYLIREKKFNTFIKMNPTLVGMDRAKEILCEKGYEKIDFSVDSFRHDITLEAAAQIAKNCRAAAEENDLIFGVKMTNTFPVNVHDNVLPGETMYMSGPSLYALSINAAALLCSAAGDLRISFSGGIDTKNIKQVLETGIRPVTVSSFLLKPGGYGNIAKLIKAAEDVSVPDKVDLASLERTAEEAVHDKNYDRKNYPVFETKDGYSSICAKCRNCTDVCPNRANARVTMKSGFDIVLHRNRLCNECGCCSFSCIMGHDPYLEKMTIYEDELDFMSDPSERDAVLVSNGEVIFRSGGHISEISGDLLEAVCNVLGIPKNIAEKMSARSAQANVYAEKQENRIQESDIK